MQKINACLWFDGRAEEAARFYVRVFPRAALGAITHYPPGAPVPAGTALTVEFTLDGVPFVALNGGPQFTFNEAVSFVVHCTDQQEVDHLWQQLTADGGAPGRCGWLKDKFGVSWQVVPVALERMLREGSAQQVQRVMAAFMPMTRLDIAPLQRAYDA
ncbi:MAG: VOC family protein [Betaproteobacteria bacterium]|nr:VOC family protein [Betaproteobacteria bacterium]MDE2047895.1 VOC family protein [Betaproteobacteria bacterium]